MPEAWPQYRYTYVEIHRARSSQAEFRSIRIQRFILEFMHRSESCLGCVRHPIKALRVKLNLGDRPAATNAEGQNSNIIFLHFFWKCIGKIRFGRTLDGLPPRPLSGRNPGSFRNDAQSPKRNAVCVCYEIPPGWIERGGSRPMCIYIAPTPRALGANTLPL